MKKIIFVVLLLSLSHSVFSAPKISKTRAFRYLKSTISKAAFREVLFYSYAPTTNIEEKRYNYRLDENGHDYCDARIEYDVLDNRKTAKAVVSFFWSDLDADRVEVKNSIPGARHPGMKDNPNYGFEITTGKHYVQLAAEDDLEFISYDLDYSSPAEYDKSLGISIYKLHFRSEAFARKFASYARVMVELCKEYDPFGDY